MNDFEKWITSKHGKDCLEMPVTDISYLRNRLWWAYDAGLKSNELQKTIDWYEGKKRESDLRIKELEKEIKKLKMNV